MKRKKTKQEFKKCFKCQKNIDDSENYIELTTYNQSKITAQIFFHMICWGQYNQDRCDQRIKEMAGMGMGMLNKLGLK